MAYIGKTPITGNFVKLDAISVVNGQAGYTMNNGGSAFTDYENVNQFLVSLNGILQAPTTSFTVSGSTLTFASNLATGDVIDFVIVLGNTLDIGTPSDATVTQAKTNFVSTSSAAGLQIKGDGTTDGTLQLNCSQNSHGIKLKSPPHSASASYTLTFPNNDGDANQVLTTNGSGVLSFADAGGGSFTKIANADYGSAVSTFTYTNCFTSDYSVYKFYMFDIDAAASNDELEIKFLDSGGSVVGNWRQVSTEIYKEQGGTGSGTGVQSTHGNNFIRCSFNDLTGNTSQPSHLEMTIYMPYESKYTTIHQKYFLRSDNGYNYFLDSYAFLESTTSLRSMTIYQDGGTNFASYKSTIYGLTR
jgi:hypothetical protein